MNRVLIVDDEEEIRWTLNEFLKDNGHETIEASNGIEALKLFKTEKPSVVLLDLKMPGIDGIECMEQMRSIDPDVPIVIITAHGDVPTAVKAVKLGAYDFMLKPPNLDILVMAIQRAIEKLNLRRTLNKLSTEIEASIELLLGKSKPMRRIIEQVRQVAQTDFSIILQGETGTGKSFIARTIHNFSRRSEESFVSVDMGVMPENLVESELFGCEKGAFTGADRKRKGYFEIAHKGTIFIDELQNMSPLTQAKLLRVVDEKRIHPLGNTTSTEVDVRIIAATNKDILKLLEEKKIKDDLFYRLGEIVISLPPLRERAEDIPFFAHKFFREAVEELKKNIVDISDDALEILKLYSWPGNIRELKNVIRRAVLFSNENILRPQHINILIKNTTEEEELELLSLKELTSKTIRNTEKEAIKKALDISKWNKSKAARILQISYMSLLTKIKEYDIHPI
jgi:two-component system response regulator AtoC